ncbi:MAG: MBOAT family protein [Clostridia bacterium]|nr:MBOAT family protein [Clostridia bacterium]
MLFSSITFIYYFLPITIFLYFVTPKKYRNIILLISSLIFYFYGERSPLLIIACILNYFFGLLIDKSKDNRKLFLSLGIIFNICLIGYYKYTNFFIENFSKVLNIDSKYLSIILPLGISFFTFQNISYLIDVYRKEVKAQKNILQYATYITFFPQLIAGPIVRYKDVNEQLANRTESFDNFAQGVKRFIIGLSKKVIIANTIGEFCAILGQAQEKTVLLYILQAIGYTLQIYFDFSGYSDMAIGMGLFFGFKFKENFNYPLIANSITDFWRRWHISLSSFFRDYVYIPLGGNRKGILRQILNILIVWSLTGFWHGANWNFILWGLYFFVFLIIEKLFLKKYLKNGIISHAYTLIVVICSFVIFNIEKLSEIGIFFKNMLGFGNLEFINFETIYYLKNYIIIILLAIICSTPLIKNIVEKLSIHKRFKNIFSFIEVSGYICLLLICTSSLISNSFNPFIYFRF